MPARPQPLLTLRGLTTSDHDCDAAGLTYVCAVVSAGNPLRGVHLYLLARPSFQPEAPRLSALPAASQSALAGRIRALGLEANVAA